MIAGFFAPLATHPGAFGLADDCAQIMPGPGQAHVFKTDPIRAGVHFLAEDPPESIAWKALAVNVSDLAAKAARPVAYLAALSFPQAPERAWLKAFCDGLAEAQDAFGMSLIGGDTDRAPGPLSICVTVIGEVAAGRAPLRSGARPGDVLFVSGTLGDAALGLSVHCADGDGDALGLNRAQAEACRARYLRPSPQLGARAALRAYATAAMDLSDGLVKDAGRMMLASGCGARINVAGLPLSDAMQAAVSINADELLRALAHGDDYEILAAVPPDRADAFVALARAGGVAMTAVGACINGSGVSVVGPDGCEMSLLKTGYAHF